MEYYLPKGWNTGFDGDHERWGTEKPYFDIVIEKVGERPEDSKFIAIELKYKHTAVESDIWRFGTYNKNIPLVTDQAAENEGRYDFWKDVKRLELLKKTFWWKNNRRYCFVCNKSNKLQTRHVL